MELLSIIQDGLLNANNALLQMTIGEYLDIGLGILKNNQYQRKRVSRSSSIYSMLESDLKRLCTIPTIVLALTDESKRDVLQVGMTSDQLKAVFENEDLIILDGLQRTYTLRDVRNEIVHSLIQDVDPNTFLNHQLRVEVYCGLSKTGILYRMLTLNTGQTQMSRRHEIEILYSSYRTRGIEGIRFNTQAAQEYEPGIDVYDFDNAIEGFNSFLDSDESPMDRFDILDVIQRLEKITEDDYNKDLFEHYIKLYNKFAHHIDEQTGHWVLSEEEKKELGSIYAKDIPAFCNKAQTMSAFGAAIGKILWDKSDRGFGNIMDRVLSVRIENTPKGVMLSLLRILKEVREGAKKIGVSQRLYLKLFFLNLLTEGSETYLAFEQSMEKAKKDYSHAINIQPRQESLFD